MTMKKTLYVAALILALAGGTAEAKRPVKGGGGGVSTNYGCTTLLAGTVLRSSDGLSQTSLSQTTWACYLCNMTTRVCALQSPSSLIGWTFIMP